MGKGKGQRRREANFLKAKELKTGKLRLPPPPTELVKKKSRGKDKGGVNEFVPRSLRKMLSVKAAAERQTGMTSRAAGKHFSAIASRKSLAKQLHEGAGEAVPLDVERTSMHSAGPISGMMFSPQMRTALQSPESADTAQPAVRQTGANEMNDEGEMRHQKSAPDIGQEELFARRTLAPRKKEFLKRKKLKRKGRLLLEAGGGDGTDVEAEVMRDLHKPSFGEQAMQPIKVNLKRKHWNTSGEYRARQRCKEVFLRQMGAAQDASKARVVSSPLPGRQQSGKQSEGLAKGARKAALEQGQAREAARVELAEAFREQRRMKLGGGKQAAASQASLARLVKRGEGSD